MAASPSPDKDMLTLPALPVKVETGALGDEVLVPFDLVELDEALAVKGQVVL